MESLTTYIFMQDESGVRIKIDARMMKEADRYRKALIDNSPFTFPEGEWELHKVISK